MNDTLDMGMYNILQEWYDYITENMNIQTDLIVYLQTSPEIVHQRMKSRGRPEEASVSLGYLKQLHDLHENWLVHGHRHCPAPLLVINADLNSDEIIEEYTRVERRIFDNNSI